MNSLTLGIILAAWLILGYRRYGRLIARKLIGPDPNRPVPSETQRDGMDFEPAPTTVLFGHHFSSIAGAGPIVGPLLGVRYFGWLPSLLWIALGSVFMGAVHDYTALMASVRNQGHSVGEIAERNLGRRVRTVLSIFMWLALVLVIAVFGVITAKTLVTQPAMVIPTFGLILVAMLFGKLVLRGSGRLLAPTLLALLALGGLIELGLLLPVRLGTTVLGLPVLTFWFWVLMLYCVLASVLPVWLLLQPRDYLSTWILYLGLGGGFLGLVVAHPHITAPALSGWDSPTHGPLWPMLLVMIACGAISGFHSLVASGTSSKQLANETDGLKVGYGAMILEGALAGLVVLLAAGALPWDASAVPAAGSLQQLISPAGGGPIVAFATGLSRVVERLPLVTGPAGLFFGILMINAFVITTLDTSTRLARFILQELGAGVPLLSGRLGATLVTVAAAGWLGASDSYTRIWPVFGATNQLVAALALIVVTAWLVSRGRPRLYTLIPALIMLVTTVTALLWQGFRFLGQGKTFLATISLGLVALALFIAWEARAILLGGRRDSGPRGNTTRTA